MKAHSAFEEIRDIPADWKIDLKTELTAERNPLPVMKVHQGVTIWKKLKKSER